VKPEIASLIRKVQEIVIKNPAKAAKLLTELMRQPSDRDKKNLIQDKTPEQHRRKKSA
jgi:hypothetical protein